jgi:histidyl-tRNA synthetase
VLQLARIEGSNAEILRQLEPLVAGSERGMEGAAKLDQLLRGVAAGGVPAERIKLDLSIARGLDYYTGTIFETTLDALPGIGSVCSGGRYDNLADLYTNQALPGIGASLGLDRLLAAMEELKLIEKVSTPAPVFLAYFDEARLDDYLRLAAAIRAAGIGVELFPDAKKLGQQLKYADRRGFRVALIAGGDEFAAGRCQIKNLAAGTQEDVALDEGARSVIEAIRKTLCAGDGPRP